MKDAFGELSAVRYYVNFEYVGQVDYKGRRR